MSIESPLRRHIETVEQVVLDRHRKYSASNISNSPGGPLNGLRVRLHDKLARLSNFVDGGAEADFEDDSLRDCFTDIVGYGLIGLLVLAGEWPGAETPAVAGPPTLEDDTGATWTWEKDASGKTGYVAHRGTVRGNSSVESRAGLRNLFPDRTFTEIR